VNWAGCVGTEPTVRLDTVDGDTLFLTGEHRVFTANRGWVHAESLVPTDILVGCRQDSPPASTAASASTARPHAADLAEQPNDGRPDNEDDPSWSTTVFAITFRLTGTTGPPGTPETNSSIAPSGVALMERYPWASTSTTETTTQATTNSPTSPTSQPVSTDDFTTPTDHAVPRSASAVENAERTSPPSTPEASSALMTVGSLTKLARPVSPGPVIAVYDLSVDGDPEFFANGILVHNCKVHHVDIFEDLEAQMTEWVPSESRDSPDRVDAMVFAITELQKKRGQASVSSPVHLKSA